MAETMEQYMSKTRTDYGSGVVRPKIVDKDNFELKGQFLKELRTNTFSSSDHEDANEHIEKVLEIVSLEALLLLPYHAASSYGYETNQLFVLKLGDLTSRVRSIETSDRLARIQAQLNNLGREIKKVNEKVYVAQVGFEQCKGTHYTKDCPLKEEKTLKEAYNTQFGRPFQGGGYRSTALGFYQRNNVNPSYQERRQSMEDTLSKFMSESAKRHEENSNLIKEIDAAIPNPRDQVKLISTTFEVDSCPIRRIGSSQYAVSTRQSRLLMYETRQTNIPFSSRCSWFTCEERMGSYGTTNSQKLTSEALRSIPQKEKDLGSFTLPCFINNICFNNALVDLGASVSVIPLSTYLNLGLGEIAHTKLTVELADRTVKYPKGIAKNVLVGIGKFTFPKDFIILDMPEDIKVPLILGRLFFSTTRAKIDVYKRKITLRVEEEKIIFTSVKPASSLIKRVYMLILEHMDDYRDEGMGNVIFGKPFDLGSKEISTNIGGGFTNLEDLEHKHEVFETFKVFQNEVENQLGKNIKAIRSNQGGEYMSREFVSHMKSCGIVSQLTSPYTPQHNEVFKRRNQTLLDMVRSMMNLTTLPKSFWGYALESATRILNIVPTKKVERMLYEIWHVKGPKFSYLRDCEALVKRDTPDKLGPISIKCIFVEEDTQPYENTSEEHNEVVPMEVEPKSVKVPICRSARIPQAPDRYGFYVDVDEYELGDLNEPPNYKAALSYPEYDKWLEAMNTEMKSMKDNQVWILVELPPNGRTVGSKWLFKKKTDMDCNVHTFKARLCMTRSSTNELFTPYKDPEREFRSSRRHFKTLSLDELRSPDFNLFFDQENSEEEEAETMAETMEQYMSKTRADYGSGVVRPKIEDKDNFELKGQFLKELRTNTFNGSNHEDANEHIEKVLEIVDLFHIPNITIYQVMLREFPMSLTGAASRWLRNKPTGSITTWEDLKTKFLSKYCLPARTAKKMEEINNFQQEPDKNLYQAWERFKELLMKCAIPSKTAADAKIAIQEMAEYSQKWHNGTSRVRNTKTSDGLVAIQA
ncbi:DNA-directed DNA polymerase [Tanacetum coccineum]